MMILSLLWLTTASPLNIAEGPGAVVEASSRTCPTSRRRRPRRCATSRRQQNKASQTDASNVKAAVDAALVTKAVDAHGRPSRPTTTASPSSTTSPSSWSCRRYELGGSNPQFWKGEFNHSTKYAVVAYCKTPTQTQTFGLPPSPPECASGADAQRGFVVVAVDYGSLRLPPFVVFVIIVDPVRARAARRCTGGRRTSMERAKAAGRPGGGARPDEPELTKV